MSKYCSIVNTLGRYARFSIFTAGKEKNTRENREDPQKEKKEAEKKHLPSPSLSPSPFPTPSPSPKPSRKKYDMFVAFVFDSEQIRWLFALKNQQVQLRGNIPDVAGSIPNSSGGRVCFFLGGFHGELTFCANAHSVSVLPQCYSRGM